ncbi:hypothetical protein LOD99_13198 [Oopsacas minuta]|uniref:Uncharacterized protein n=1 Tax=Oopsacas minuta TaxID=111878 RepID=A0AAV7JB60_9METZ|nr:hypothetical protein LOD99_13198 [Oopsacas minuta]
MCQTAARQEVENFYALINQWKETRCLIETKLYSVSPQDNIQILKELDRMEEHLKLTPEWNSCRTMNDVRLVILGTVESRKSLLVNKYLYGTLDVEIPDEVEIRHKKDVYMEGKNQLLLIREISGEPSTQVAIWADTMMFVFSLENMESFISIYTSYRQVLEYRSRRGLGLIPTVLIGIQDSSLQRCVTHSEAISLATNHMNNSPYIEVTPANGINVESSFHRACKPILFSHMTYNFSRTKKSTSVNTRLDEITSDENGQLPYKLMRQSSLPSSHESTSSQVIKRKKVNKKFYQMKSNYEISNGVPLLGTGRDIPIKESKILKRGNKRKKDWKKKLLVLTQNTLTYYPTTHDYMNQINGKSINLLHCTVKIPGKDPTGVTRSNLSTSIKNAQTFPRALRMHSITETTGRKRNKNDDQDHNIGFMSDGMLTDMSDEEDFFSASAVFSKPTSVINPLFTNIPNSPIDDSLTNKLSKSSATGKETSSDPEEDIPGIFYSSVEMPADKKKTPKKIQTYLKSGHVRGKSDATLQKFLVPAATDNIATFEFHVISLDGRYWVFDAGSSEEQENWIKVIEQQIHAALIATTGDRKAYMAGSGSPELRQLKLELNPLPLTTWDIDIPSVLLSVRVGNISGGYNPDIFDEMVEDFFLCHICKGVLKDALLTPCGHVFCKVCLYQAKFYSQHTETRCPLDNIPLSMDKITEEDFINRWVRQKRIQCPLKAKGCEWNGELGDCKRHLNTACQMFRIKCSQGCGAVVMRCEVDSHTTKQCLMRKVGCKYCTGEVCLGEMDKHWSTRCNMFPTPCPNNCQTLTVERRKMKRHLEDFCPLSVLPCKYQRYGCEHECSRREMPCHLSTDIQAHLEHLNIHTEVIEETHRTEVERLERRIYALEEMMSSVANRSPYIWQISGISTKMESGAIVVSPCIYTNNGMEFRLKMYCDGLDENYTSFISLVVCFSDNSIDTPLQLKLQISLLNQLSNTLHHVVETELEVIGTEEVVNPSLIQFKSHSQIRQSSYLFRYMQNDIIYIKVNATLISEAPRSWLKNV